MEIRTAKTGRVIVELDGYSEGYKAYVQGAVTGVVSLPASFQEINSDELGNIAKDCLNDAANGTANKQYYGAKIIRKAGKIF
jgi:hypothetical protein